MTDLEAVMLEDTRVLLARWRREFAGRPGAERGRLLRLALEREQIVAVAYREEAVAGRVAELDVGAAARALIRQTLMWIWKDEQLHFEFMRGLLLGSGSLASTRRGHGRCGALCPGGLRPRRPGSRRDRRRCGPGRPAP